MRQDERFNASRKLEKRVRESENQREKERDGWTRNRTTNMSLLLASRESIFKLEFKCLWVAVDISICLKIKQFGWRYRPHHPAHILAPKNPQRQPSCVARIPSSQDIRLNVYHCDIKFGRQEKICQWVKMLPLFSLQFNFAHFPGNHFPGA